MTLERHLAKIRYALIILAVFASVASLPSVAQAGGYYQPPPPPMRAEIVPGGRNGFVWDPGHWHWAGNGYVWLPGHWQQMHEGRWVPGHWVAVGPSWVWQEGHWAR